MHNLRKIIPVNKIKVVEKALLNAFNTTIVKEISQLTGGLSGSPVYKILVNDLEYVLKLDNPTPSINDHLLSCMQIAADGGIAPPVHYLNKAEGITITGFIKNMPIRATLAAPRELLPKLAEAIRSIHELPAFPVENNLVDIVDDLITQFKLAGISTGVVFDECFSYYEKIRKHYPWQDMEKVSSHNDLNPNNIVFDGEKIWIIDWDAAFVNDRYVDLAIIANFYIANDDQEDIFLKAYFGDNLDDYHKSRFFLMRQICRIVYAMLMFKVADSTKPKDIEHDLNMQNVSMKKLKEQFGSGELSPSAYNGQLLLGKALLIEALNNMRLPRFISSINSLKNK